MPDGYQTYPSKRRGYETGWLSLPCMALLWRVFPSRDHLSDSIGLADNSDCNVLYRDELNLGTPRTRAASAAALVPFRIPVVWSTRLDHRSLMSVSQAMPLVDGAASGADVAAGSGVCGGNIVGCGGVTGVAGGVIAGIKLGVAGSVIVGGGVTGG